ncbi:hypothetical protein [Rhabdothermincola sediminis]|uniref:hypothetical protein n=1 Tax=Rhabdothermincola sediminis TaxID=2751370 RepID=UPI001AA087E2|nr:hypothetical protein [Rhabdothermincola sediminis]
MTPRPAAVARPEQNLVAWLRTTTFGSLRPVEVQVRRDLDADGREAWFFEVTLPNPPEGEDTWPITDLNELQRALRDQATKEGLAWPWYVRFRPEIDDLEPEEPENGS